MRLFFFYIFRNIESAQQNELSKAKNRLAKLQREKMALEKVKQKKLEDARKLVVQKDEFLPHRVWTIENLDGYVKLRNFLTVFLT